MPQPAVAHPDAGFREYRIALIHASNRAAYLHVAALVLAFNAWDWFVDPAHALHALWIRLAGAAVIVVSGLYQHRTGPAHAPLAAKVRLLATAVSISGALAVLDDGFLVGLSGLVIAMIGAAYSSVDRRDALVMSMPPLLVSLAIMAADGTGRFVFINAACFLALSVAVSWLLSGMLGASYRRAYELEHALLRESRIDALTGVLNRRALEEQGKSALSLCQRHGQAFSVLMIDIDFFKDINDRYGHPVGDQVLNALAGQCRKLTRGSDRFGRWGGEEFLAVLPETPIAQAQGLAERMRAAIAQTGFEFGGDTQRVTVSIGVAGEDLLVWTDTAETWSRLVSAADDAMYRAKHAGRNRVEVATVEAVAAAAAG
jgi:diguanylate cyclase (GGDEF)-like protein